MAQGLDVALPLYIDSIDGAYGLRKNLEEVVTQNLKMIILTSPGERVMVPKFGVEFEDTCSIRTRQALKPLLIVPFEDKWRHIFLMS